MVLGEASRVAEARRTLNLLGGTLDPHAAWLLQRGIKTLGLRMQAMCRGATHLARVLDEHPDVRRVLHPSLPQHPSYERASEWFDLPGFMLAFEVDGDARAAERVLEALELPLVAPSLGGVETLVTRPAVSSHASLSARERASQGIDDGLIRVSVGIEDPDDLAADFVQALSRWHDSR